MEYKLFMCIAIITVLFVSLQGQIYIGEENDNITGTSTLLSFEDDSGNNTKGIILSAVTSLQENPANGTFVFDTNDSKVKVFVGIGNGEADEDGWLLLSEQGNSIQINDNLNPAADVGEGTTIGDDISDNTEGVLVLKSTDKAMILPKIANPEDNVKSPYPGMMCYDTVSKSLAVFDGSKWYFWK